MAREVMRREDVLWRIINEENSKILGMVSKETGRLVNEWKKDFLMELFDNNLLIGALDISDFTFVDETERYSNERSTINVGLYTGGEHKQFRYDLEIVRNMSSKHLTLRILRSMPVEEDGHGLCFTLTNGIDSIEKFQKIMASKCWCTESACTDEILQGVWAEDAQWNSIQDNETMWSILKDFLRTSDMSLDCFGYMKGFRVLVDSRFADVFFEFTTDRGAHLHFGQVSWTLGNEMMISIGTILDYAFQDEEEKVHIMTYSAICSLGRVLHILRNWFWHPAHNSGNAYPGNSSRNEVEFENLEKNKEFCVLHQRGRHVIMDLY